MRAHKRSRWLSWLVAAISVATAVPARAQKPAAPEGCSLQGLGPDAANGLRVSRTCGNPQIDADLLANLNLLTGRFKVFPRFYYLDDTGAPNALSMPDSIGAEEDFPPVCKPFGTIVLGVNLINLEMRSTPQGDRNFTLVGIMAHELGHTVQALKGNNEPTPFRELEADFLAGWATRGLKRTVAPQLDETKVFSSFYNKGDYLFNNPQHHGTKAERLDAFLAGFRLKDADVDTAYDRAVAYVKEHPPGSDDDDDDDNPPQQAPAAPTFAANLGIYYERIANADGTFAARIARPPEPGSPAALGGLEEGDVIIMLDGTPFRTAEDVLNHKERTTVTVIDVRTKMQVEAVIQIP